MQPRAAIFDLDGVLTDTAELHYQSWQILADELKLPFDRKANEALRGLSREESLARVLGTASGRFSEHEKRDITQQKNDIYLQRVASMSADDLFPGASKLLIDLRATGFLLGLASSSRNAHVVLGQLGIKALLDQIVDGNDAPRSKPDPQVFQLTAQRLGVPADRCVVVEDAESGVAAARDAGMRVIGIGPIERVGRADFRVDDIAQLTVGHFERFVPLR